MKRNIKKIVSMVLTFSLVLSSLVFSLNLNANGESAGNYHVRVTINVLGTNNFTGAYAGFAGKKGDTAGVSIGYMATNGTGGVSYKDWDIGNGSTGNSNIKSKGAHTLEADIAGFPSIVYCYLCDNYWFSSAKFQVTKVEVSKSSSSSYTTLWTGNIQVASKTNGYGESVDYNGNEKLDYDTSGDSDNFINNSSGSWASKFPYASSISASYASSSKNCPSSSSSSAVTNSLSYSATDQYGVTMASSLCSVSVRGSSSGTTGISSTNSHSGSDTTSCAYSANISGAVSSQSVTATCSWNGSTSKSKTASFTLYDASYTADWSWMETNTSNVSEPYSKSSSSTFYFGSTPTNSSAPTSYYDSDNHYTAGKFSTNTATTNVSYTMNYTVSAHSYSATVLSQATCTVSGSTKYTCSCGYSYTDTSVPSALGHDYKKTVTSPTCTSQGYSTYTCSRCNDSYVADYTAPLGHDYSLQTVSDATLRTKATCNSPATYYYTCSRCGDINKAEGSPYFSSGNKLEHIYSSWATVTAPTCTEKGLEKRTCSLCGNVESRDIEAIGHNKVIAQIKPEDCTEGYIYYKCTRCDTVWSASIDTTTGEYTSSGEPSKNIDSIKESTDPVPAPSFNTFNDESINYDYSNRGAGLKLDDITYTDQNTVQNTRFTGSMLVPTGIDYSFSTSNNAVTDFGFVYSQSELIDYDISNLEYGKSKVYKMSVSAQNSGTFNGSNWVGVSSHLSQEGTYLTFNLLIGIKAKNWSKDYCARAYITYNYMGFTYSVYDQDFSSRSVQYIAENVVANDGETAFARNYCQTKILNHI